MVTKTPKSSPFLRQGRSVHTAGISIQIHFCKTKVLDVTRTTLSQKRTALRGFGDHLSSESAKWHWGEIIVGFFGRRVIWQVNSKLGRKQTGPQDVIICRKGSEAWAAAVCADLVSKQEGPLPSSTQPITSLWSLAYLFSPLPKCTGSAFWALSIPCGICYLKS